MIRFFRISSPLFEFNRIHNLKNIFSRIYPLLDKKVFIKQSASFNMIDDFCAGQNFSKVIDYKQGI